MKYRLLFFIAFPFIFQKVKAQYALAGIPSGSYVDIVPDTLLEPNYMVNPSQESDTLDINQDGIKDLFFYCFAAHSPGGAQYYCRVTSLDANLQLYRWRVDSMHYTGYPAFPYGNILKPFLNGDTIKNGSYVNNGYLAVYDRLSMDQLSDTDWVEPVDQYIGVKYTSGVNLAYGWVRVFVSGYTKVLVKDFSLGNYVVSVEELTKQKSFYLYPNPATDIVHVGNGAEQWTLLDLGGNRLLKSTDKEFDFSSFPNGIYFIRSSDAHVVRWQKLIVQH